MNRVLWTLAICGCLTIVTGAAAGGGPTVNNPTRLTISSLDIRGDSYGDFVDGVGGVKCFVDTDKFQLNLQKVSKPKRSLTYILHRLDSIDPRTCGEGLGGPITGSITDTGYFNVLGIAKMAPGTSGQYTARFFNSVGAFIFGDVSPLSEETHCSAQVEVSRSSDGKQWVVTSDPTGATVAWFKKNLNDFAGNYEFQFYMIINCPTCP